VATIMSTLDIVLIVVGAQAVALYAAWSICRTGQAADMLDHPDATPDEPRAGDALALVA